MSERKVLKWHIPVDDRDHPIGSGPVVLVGCQNGDYTAVQVWTEESGPVTPRRARVYGTGQRLPANDAHIGSVVAPTLPPKTLVWHVYAIAGDDA